MKIIRTNTVIESHTTSALESENIFIQSNQSVVNKIPKIITILLSDANHRDSAFQHENTKKGYQWRKELACALQLGYQSTRVRKEQGQHLTFVVVC